MVHMHHEEGIVGGMYAGSAAQKRETAFGIDGGRLMTPYEKLKYVLTNDQRCLKEISLGKRIGFYHVKGDIGSGNFSQVKVAVHSLTRERVAIKILDKTKLDSKTLRLLSREVSSMERLKHPNIVRLYEVVETLAKIHMIMEFASCGDLFTRIAAEGRLCEADAKVVFCQIVSALKHMHGRSIVHRDLKAENVFYSAPNLVKVGDLGFSKFSPPSEQLATFCGSPPYAAPELFEDASYEGRRVDIWALGVVLYFMVTGNTPFRAETVGKLRLRILSGDFTTPPHVSQECRALVCGTLRRVPADRLSLDEMGTSTWLRGQEFPEPLLPFEHDPALALRSSSADEIEATRAMRDLGITASVIQEAHGGGVRGSVTGVYRIVLHRIQREKRVPKNVTTARGTSGKFLNKLYGLTDSNGRASRICTLL